MNNHYVNKVLTKLCLHYVNLLTKNNESSIASAIAIIII